MHKTLARIRNLVTLVTVAAWFLAACATEPAAEFAKPPSGDEERMASSVVCTSEKPTGSNIRQTVCRRVLTGEEAEEQAAEARDVLRKIDEASDYQRMRGASVRR